MSKLIALDAAVDLVDPGSHIAFSGGGALMRRPMAFVRALAAAGIGELHVHHLLGGIETDLLIGAGSIASTNCVYIGLLEHGQGPNFQRAAVDGSIEVREHSEFMYMTGLRAADLGLPFLPCLTPWGSDMVTELGLKTVTDPYTGRTLLAVPATQLDLAVIQVERADLDGYVQAPSEPDLIWDYDYLVARAARRTIVCADQVVERLEAGRVALLGREVDYVVQTPHGAWPTGLHPLYGPDIPHVMDEYLPAARAGGEAFRVYLTETVTAGALR
jgi:glutaconate CoA-transferase subunit A